MTLAAHGDVRIDEWWWLRDRDDPLVLRQLEAENAYAEQFFAPLAQLQESLYQGIKRRIKEDDVSVPTRRHGFWYWTATSEGDQYVRFYRRRPGSADENAVDALAVANAGEGALILDENELAAGHDYFALGVFDISVDQRTLAYATNTDGSEQYQLRFRDLATGVDRDEVIERVYYGSAWSTDSSTFFYIRPDDAMRPYQVWGHRLGTPVETDRLVFDERDDRFFVSIALTRSERFILIRSESKLTTEYRYLDGASPDGDAIVIRPRLQDVEYYVEHAVIRGRDVWLLRTNEADDDGLVATNFALSVVPVDASEPPRVLLAHDPTVKIEDVDAFATHAVVSERSNGLERLVVIDLSDETSRLVEQPDPVFALTGAPNPEWGSKTYRFGYTSLVTPLSTIEYDLGTRQRTTIKVQSVLGHFDPSEYTSERIWAEASDGAEIPISLVSRCDVPRDGSAPLLLYGYGAYEASIDPTFSIARLNLLERGVMYAIAHVRGGGEMGRAWHEQGRLSHKPNTFTDFITCAEYLIDERYTSADHLVIRGASAGGLLIGAVLNARPELFAAAIAEVPFVDVVSTMSDETLPLTVTEWEEWGNPVADESAYALMRRYSPYDNVREQPYPAVFVTAGLNDPRVGYWEPAKWVAKLRRNSTSGKPIVLRTELGAGHGGSSGRYDAWSDEARVQAFILNSVGISE